VIPIPMQVPSAAGPLHATAIWNALLTHAGAALPMANGAARLTFAPSDPPPGDALCLRTRTGDSSPLFIVPRAFPFKATFGVDLTVESFPDLPSVLSTALVEGIVATIRPLLGEHQGLIAAGAVVTSLSIAGAEATGRATTWLDVRIDGLAKEPVMLSIGGDLLRLAVHLFGEGLLPAPVMNGLGRTIRVPIAVTLARLELSRHEIAALDVGDLLVLGADTAPSLRSHNRFYRLTETPQGWVIAALDDWNVGQVLRERTPRMQNEGPDGGGGATVVAGLPFSVDVDVATLDVSLADLEAWRAGSLIPLPIPAVGQGVPVTLSVAGRRIANGDLVRIDDRLAVRLTRL
jgi:flagellar motor switch/type III secretory pathway protein FliN